MDANNEYNGYANYETWNVALWLGNDEGLYNLAKEYRYRGYKALAECLEEIDCVQTPDGVFWSDSALDFEALDEYLKEL